MMTTSTYKRSSLTDHVLNYFEEDYKYIFLDVEPTPASRPRVSKWGTFYGKNYERFRREVRDFLIDYEGLSTDTPLVVLMEIIVTPPKTTKRDYPRGDVDNFAKGPLDSMTHSEKFWKDDDQILSLFVTKRFAEEGEAAGIHIYYAHSRS